MRRLSERDPVLQWPSEIPAHLFKYFSVPNAEYQERVRQLVVESSLYFASPQKFNDPLDCRIPPSFEANTLTIEGYWKEHLDREAPRMDRADRKAAVKKMVRESRSAEGRERLTRRCFDAVDAHGVACMSTDPVSMLMWSYYSAGHSGLVVRLKTTLEHFSQISPFATPVRVNYAEQFPTINFYTDSVGHFVQTVLGTKSEAWRHENEWRLILVGRTGAVTLPRTMVDGVILGMKTPPEIEKMVRAWVLEAATPIELLRVVHRPSSFLLALEPANDPDVSPAELK